jgi:hypothetical protein
MIGFEVGDSIGESSDVVCEALGEGSDGVCESKEGVLESKEVIVNSHTQQYILYNINVYIILLNIRWIQFKSNEKHEKKDDC